MHTFQRTLSLTPRNLQLTAEWIRDKLLPYMVRFGPDSMLHNDEQFLQQLLRTLVNMHIVRKPPPRSSSFCDIYGKPTRGSDPINHNILRDNDENEDDVEYDLQGVENFQTHDHSHCDVLIDEKLEDELNEQELSEIELRFEMSLCKSGVTFHEKHDSVISPRSYSRRSLDMNKPINYCQSMNNLRLILHPEKLDKSKSVHVTAHVLAQSRMHFALLEIMETASYWPLNIIRHCRAVLREWEACLGFPIKFLRAPLHGPRGRLAKVMRRCDITRADVLKRWGEAKIKKSLKTAHQYGSLTFKPGSWWINGMHAFYDGIIDDMCTDGGICADSNGAYAIVLANRMNLLDETPTTFRYRCKAREPGRFRLCTHCNGITRLYRVLKSHTLRSPFAPRVGLRYDGLYRLIGWSVYPAWKSEDDQVPLIWEMEFERVGGQVCLSAVNERPSLAEVDDFFEFKRQRRVHLTKLQKKVVIKIAKLQASQKVWQGNRLSCQSSSKNHKTGLARHDSAKSFPSWRKVYAKDDLYLTMMTDKRGKKTTRIHSNLIFSPIESFEWDSESDLDPKFEVRREKPAVRRISIRSVSLDSHKRRLQSNARGLSFAENDLSILSEAIRISFGDLLEKDYEYPSIYQEYNVMKEVEESRAAAAAKLNATSKLSIQSGDSENLYSPSSIKTSVIPDMVRLQISCEQNSAIRQSNLPDNSQTKAMSSTVGKLLFCAPIFNIPNWNMNDNSTRCLIYVPDSLKMQKVVRAIYQILSWDTDDIQTLIRFKMALDILYIQLQHPEYADLVLPHMVTNNVDMQNVDVILTCMLSLQSMTEGDSATEELTSKLKNMHGLNNYKPRPINEGRRLLRELSSCESPRGSLQPKLKIQN